MSTDDDVAGRRPTKPVLNLLGERIRLTEMHRQGELPDGDYRQRMAALDRTVGSGPIAQSESRVATHQ